MKDLLELSSVSPAWIRDILDLAARVKARPADWRRALDGRTLILMFEKPSLRTRVSFETGMAQLGGQAIHYDLSTSPLGQGKESVADTARTLSRYVDAIMARLFSHRTIRDLARYATVPVINGLTDDAHPTQVLADLQTIVEHKGGLAGRTLAYLGDGCNNVTHSLIHACARTGLNLSVGCPPDPAFQPLPAVLRRARAAAARSGARLAVTADPVAAVRGADVVYTDSWMSYHIPAAELQTRLRALAPYRVTPALMRRADRSAIFMHCLPATRGVEMTAEVIDGPRSVVFDQAENRLHMHKAILLRLLGAA